MASPDLTSLRQAAILGVTRDPYLANGVLELADRVTELILSENRARQEAARAEVARDRLSVELEKLRAELAAERSALAKVERDLGDAEREICALRDNVRDAFG